MNHPLTQLAEQLEQTLGQGNLNSDTRSWGMALVDRLRAPVQIVVMGPRGSGKSTLINMLVGAPVVPGIDDIPVLEIVGGADDGMTYELLDGTTGEATPDAVPEGTMRITRTVQVPALEECAFAEVNLTGASDQSEAVLQWAVERADIILWCTERFGEEERALWGRVPDELKDHSFLVLTMADRQMMKGVLTETITGLAEVVAEEFLSLFPVATLQALAAQAEPDHMRNGIWKTSGGKALRDAVFKRVEHGRLADQDNARLFLSRFAGLRQPHAAGPRRMPDKQVIRHAASGSVSATVLDDALALLQREAERMLAAVPPGGEGEPGQVLERCVDVAAGLSDLLGQVSTDDSSIEDLREDAAESAEMMLLFQLEKSEDAAADAVTLLLQLKKEIGARAIG